MRTKLAIATLIGAAGCVAAEPVFSYDFVGMQFDDYQDLIPLGNGVDDGGTPGDPSDDTVRGAFIAGGSGDLAIQHFLDAVNANLDGGAAAFKLNGVTLEAGTEYTVTVTAAQFRQGWDTGVGFYAGFAETEPSDPNFIPIAETLFTVPSNDNGVYGPMNDYSFTYTPASDLVDPWFMVRTDQDELLIDAAQSRIIVDAFTIDDGASGGGCNVADIAAPFGILDLNDISAFVDSFTGGCP